MYALTYTQLDSNLITRTTGEHSLRRFGPAPRLRHDATLPHADPMRRRLESDEKLSSGTFASMEKLREIDYPRSET